MHTLNKHSQGVRFCSGQIARRPDPAAPGHFRKIVAPHLFPYAGPTLGKCLTDTLKKGVNLSLFLTRIPRKKNIHTLSGLFVKDVVKAAPRYNPRKQNRVTRKFFL